MPSEGLIKFAADMISEEWMAFLRVASTVGIAFGLAAIFTYARGTRERRPHSFRRRR